MNAKWSPKSLNVMIPNSASFEEYQNVLMKIESNETKPEIFGLSSASSVSRNITFCRNLLKNLRKIHFNIDDSENYEKRIKPLIALWRKSSTVSQMLLEIYFSCFLSFSYLELQHFFARNDKGELNRRSESLETF